MHGGWGAKVISIAGPYFANMNVFHKVFHLHSDPHQAELGLGTAFFQVTD